MTLKIRSSLSGTDTGDATGAGRTGAASPGESIACCAVAQGPVINQAIPAATAHQPPRRFMLHTRRYASWQGYEVTPCYGSNWLTLLRCLRTAIPLRSGVSL